jgi:arylsulfatase
LFSGTDSHLAGLGAIPEFSPPLVPAASPHFGKPGYEGYLNFSVASLSELMTDAGYNTYMAGKWHLGLTRETSPASRGMKRSFALLEGAAHHLGGSAMGIDEASFSRYAFYREDSGDVISVDDDFYSTRDFTERLKGFIDMDRDEEKPFFAYLSYTAPHSPLQAPADSIARFSGVYDEGYEVLYRNRLAKMEDQGLLPAGASEFGPASFQPAWDSLDDEEKKTEARRMEIYAAMISDMDKYIGDLISYLQSIDEFDNTVIFFMSDNGAASSRAPAPFTSFIARYRDNSFENMGKATSFVFYGPNWATVSGGPFRDNKGSIYEGGFRVPAFVHFPRAIQAEQIFAEPASVMDLLPTFLALAESPVPGSSYKGREIHPPGGESLLPVFQGLSESAHDDDDYYIAREFYGQKSLRNGDWKITFMPPRTNVPGVPGRSAANGHDGWQLFNLIDDPSEQIDVAAENAEKLAELLALWNDYSSDVGLLQ